MCAWVQTLVIKDNMGNADVAYTPGTDGIKIKHTVFQLCIGQKWSKMTQLNDRADKFRVQILLVYRNQFGWQ